MFKIYADNELIYDSTLSDYVITRGVITKELNKSGSFVFTIYSSHPYYNRLQKMKTIITVFKGEKKVFRGRVIKEVIGFFKDKTFTCEGELGFLLDSIQRPFEFNGPPTHLLTQFIESHNSQVDATKRFTIGEVTVTDPNDYIARSNSAYETTLSNLQSRLLTPLGGYLFITEDESGNRIINWYADSPYRSAQKIEFGSNLLSFSRTNQAGDIATAIIPLGVEIEDPETGEKSRLTITDENEGVDYVYNQDAVNLYGWIYKVETWDDVTLASNLKKKAEAFLAEKIKQSITIELSAIDLSLMDKSIDDFSLGDYIRITSVPHGVDDDYLLQKQTIDLLKPDNDTITLGYSYSSFTDRTSVQNTSTNDLVKTVATIDRDYVSNTVVDSEVQELKSLITQSVSGISSMVSSEYVVNGELESAIASLFTQFDDAFEFRFTTIESTVNENDIERRREYREITNYIRLVEDGIILGEIGNEITLKIENDKLSIREGETEVAYFNNHKLYITNAEILESMRIGNFAFFPRANGNLSFKKIGG